MDALTGRKRSAGKFRQALEDGQRMLLPALVLYEWLRGPRTPEELALQEVLFPPESVIAFGSREAAVSAQLYRAVRRPRGRELDLAIAACAITRETPLWTLNISDFEDIPNLRLYSV